MAGRTSKTRTQSCNREHALSRLQQAESFVEVADMVVTGSDNDVATPGVAAALAVLAGIAAGDAACCATLKMRPRGQDHKEAVPMLATVHPHGPQMSKDLERLLNRKDPAHDGLHLIGKGDAEKMVEWAKRLVGNARKVLEAGRQARIEAPGVGSPRSAPAAPHVSPRAHTPIRPASAIEGASRRPRPLEPRAELAQARRVVHPGDQMPARQPPCDPEGPSLQSDGDVTHAPGDRRAPRRFQ